MVQKTRVLIIGAVALGPKAACRIKRLQPEFDVTMVDQQELISYGGCGIPYYISGDISDIKELMSTSFHMVRTPEFFEAAKGVHVRTRTRVLAIDRGNKTVRVKSLDSGQEEDLPYDKLVIATGSRPRRLDLPGVDLPGVTSVANLHQAVSIKEKISQGQVEKAVIIGAGAIGLELAEALSDLWGVETAVVEFGDQVLPELMDPILARMVAEHLKEQGVSLHLSEEVKEIRAGAGGEGLSVVTAARRLPADLVITAVGVRPNSELARQAGLQMGVTGGIIVNERLQTSDPDIFAGGDCIENLLLISGKPIYFPSGSLANRQGRVIGTNVAGGQALFSGIVGSFTLKSFNMAIAGSGLTLAAAQGEGFDAVQALVVQADRAHFYHTQDLMYLTLVVDRQTRRLLGAQGVSANGDALVGRINSIAALLQQRGAVEDLSNLEVAYAPPFAAAMDIVNALANTAENLIQGLGKTVDVEEFERCVLDGSDDAVCLDVRGPANAGPFVEAYGERWVNIPQETLGQRFHEVPRDKRLLVVCNSGVRSYEALRQLESAGIYDVFNLQGGVALLKKTGAVRLEGGEEEGKPLE